MKTHFYVDFYFILNFTMNLFLIMLTAMLRQKRCRMCRFLCLGAVNAVFSVAVTYVFWKKEQPQIIIAVLQILEIVYLAYEWEGCQNYRKDFFVFFFLTFFTGGLVSAVQGIFLRVFQDDKAYSVQFILPALFVLFCLFFLLRWEFIREEHARISIRRALVVHKGIQLKIRVLYDTGNQLTSPYTGEPVAVISKELAELLLLEQKQAPVLIPYHSIGGNGLLNAYRIEKLRVEGGMEKKNFLAAVSENLTKEQGVQMILNIT